MVLGIFANDPFAVGFGLFIGLATSFLDAWCSRFFDPLVARYQRSLYKGVPRILVNIAAFAWAIGLCTLAMLAPLLVLGGASLSRMPK